MNILLFIPDKDKTVGGIFQYINCLINLVGRSDNKNKYYLFLRNNSEIFKEYSIKYPNIICIPEQESGNKSSLYNTKDKILKGIQKLLLKLKINIKINTTSSLDKIIEKYNIDIVHFPYQRLIKTNKPSITTMHDVQELYFPQYFTSTERAERAVNYKYCIDNADQVVVSYQHIKNDITQFFDKPENQIQVILLNMENLWFEKFNSDSIIKNLTDKPFILCPAVTWQHKNHLNLLKAILHLKESKKQIINLICTGKKTDYYFKVLEPFISSNNLQHQVFFKGIVSDEELYTLYKTCLGVVVPTKYEAGSFPLMESILIGVPVICSNVTSLPETIGCLDYTFDPDNINEIAEKIERLYLSEEFRKNCIVQNEKQRVILLNTGAYEKLSNLYSTLIKK